MKKCPFCAEEVQTEAIICRYCGRDIDPELVEKVLSRQASVLGASRDARPPEERAAASEPATAKPATRKAKSGQIGLAVLLAGTIPITLSVLVLALLNAVGVESLPAGLHTLVFAIYLCLGFVFHLVPLPLGLWAGLAWPGAHFKGHTLLGLSAGVVEMVSAWGLSNALLSSTPLGFVDYLFALGTVSLFIAGGLFGDLGEMFLGWRRIKDLRHVTNLWGKRAVVHGYKSTLNYGYKVVYRESDSPEPTEKVASEAVIEDCRKGELTPSWAHQYLRSFAQQRSSSTDAHGSITVQPAVNSGTSKPNEYRAVRRESDSPESTEKVASEAISSGTSRPSERTVLLMQTMVPGCFTLVGAITTASATLLKGTIF